MSLFGKFSQARQKDVQAYQADVKSIRRKVEAEFAELAYHTLDLKRGLQRNEFQVLYLPKIDLSSGDILAVKAVLRWDHPHRGLLPPQSFVPYAEKSGIMPALGNWMVEQVLKDLNEMRAIGLSPLPVTIALTEKQCQSPNLASKVSNLISKKVFSPCDLNFEVPQQTQQKNDAATVSNLRVLRWLGVQCSANQSSVLNEIGSQIYPVQADDADSSEDADSSDSNKLKMAGYFYGEPMSFEQVCENVFDKVSLAV